MRIVSFLLCAVLLGCSTPKKEQTATEAVTTGAPARSLEASELPPIVEPKTNPEDGIMLRLNLKPGTKELREVTGNVKIELDKSKVKPGTPSVIDSIISLQYTTEVIERKENRTHVRIVTKPMQTTTSGGTSSTQAEDFVVIFDECANPLNNYDGLIKSAISAGFLRFPKSRLKEGSTWSLTSARDVPVIGEITYKETYTYKGTINKFGKKVWQIEVITSGTDELKTKANYFFDSLSGCLVQADIYQEVKAEIPQETGGVPAKISMTAHFRPRSI